MYLITLSRPGDKTEDSLDDLCQGHAVIKNNVLDKYIERRHYMPDTVLKACMQRSM